MAQDANNQPDAPQEGIPAPEGPANLIDTDYVIGQDNIQTSKFGLNVDLHGKVFSVSSLLILFFVIITLALPEQMGPIFNGAKSFLTDNLSWLFLFAANIFVLLSVVLIFTPLGKVRIGGLHAKPDFSYAGWFAMLFAAGMGIGLMFYGVSEPMTHFDTSISGDSWAPLGGAQGDQAQRNRWPWPPRFSIGACTRGGFTRWSPCRWRCSPSTRACR